MGQGSWRSGGGTRPGISRRGGISTFRRLFPAANEAQLCHPPAHGSERSVTRGVGHARESEGGARTPWSHPPSPQRHAHQIILGALLQSCRTRLTSDTAPRQPSGIAKLEFFAEDPGQLMTPRGAHGEGRCRSSTLDTPPLAKGSNVPYAQ